MFAGPPTHFGPEKLGYMYAAPFIGALSAYFFGASVSDWSAKWMARKNKNIYEPEFRILLVIPVAFFGLPGLYAYGHVADMHLHWIFPSLLYGFLTFAVVMSCTATFSYILDAHRDIAVEMLVSMLLLKNFFAFGCTYFLVDWVENDVRPLLEPSRPPTNYSAKTGSFKSFRHPRSDTDSCLRLVHPHVRFWEGPA